MYVLLTISIRLFLSSWLDFGILWTKTKKMNNNNI